MPTTIFCAASNDPVGNTPKLVSNICAIHIHIVILNDI
jgi:hypothetical protein